MGCDTPNRQKGSQIGKISNLCRAMVALILLAKERKDTLFFNKTLQENWFARTFLICYLCKGEESIVVIIGL